MNPWVRRAAGLAIVAAAPAQRTAAIHQGYGIRATAVVLVAVVTIAALDRAKGERSHPAMLLGVVGFAGLAGAVAGGRIVGLWMVASALLAAFAAFGHPLPRLPGLPARPRFETRSLLPIVALVLGSARVARTADRLTLALVWFALAGLAALLLAERPEAPGRVVRSVARGLRRVLTVVLLGPLWVLAVLVPWVLQRVVRVDPLAAAFDPASSWLPRRGGPEEPHRLWFPDPRRDRPSWFRRLHARSPGLLGASLVLLAVGSVIVSQVVLPAIDPPPRNEGERLLGASAFSADLRRANDEAIGKIAFSQYVGNEWTDHESTHLNVTDGRRRTWSPTGCTADPTSVWLFGGSTAFGVYQRDDFTIPSELAKAAAERGFRFEVENWGMPGDVAWQQARRLERALASGDRPDVVVFYDGWNDLRAVADMDFSGRGGPTDFIGPLDRLQMRTLSEQGGMAPGERYTIEVPEVGPGLAIDEVLDLAALSYATAHRSARLLAEADGFELVHTYQPSLHSRSPQRPGEPHSDPAQRRLIARFRARLPETVVDLGGVLDEASDVYFYDETHTVEAANPAIADAILREVLETSDALDRGAPCR